LRRLSAIAVAFFVLGTLTLSMIPAHFESSEKVGRGTPSFVKNALVFPGGLNTSSSVKEYPLIARGLMLPSGSTDAALADLNGDHLTDLIVAVYETKNVSIFYRESDGNFSSYPSYNISLRGHPIAVTAVDVLATGTPQVIVLERKAGMFDNDHLEVFNYTSETSFVRVFDRPPSLENATGLAVGDFNGDTHLDIAVSAAGPSPSLLEGRIEISYGPTFPSWNVFLNGGRGTNSLVVGDFNSDGKSDLACANHYDSNVLIYYQPYSNLMPPNLTLSVVGQPVDLVAGDLDSNAHTDIAVVTTGPNLASFFLQSLVGPSLYALPGTENYNRSLPVGPSGVISGDMNGDSRDDLLVLSSSANKAHGFYQHPTNPVWSNAADFDFPTQAGPQNAIIGELDSDSNSDLAVMGARGDWSGSSLSIYPGHPSLTNPYYRFTNSNQTVLTDPNAVASMFATGDIDGDGIEDLVILYPSMDSFGYMLSFDPPMKNYSGIGFGLGEIPDKMIVADFNGDGYDDILVAATNSTEMKIYYGNDLTTVSFQSETLSCGGVVSDVVTGDIDNDSLLDLAVSTANGLIDVFHNAGVALNPYSEPEEVAPTPGTNIPALAIGDFNSDGLNDLAYTNSTRSTCTIGIFLQRASNSSISLPANVNLTSSTVGHFDRVWSADLNGDGKMDIAALPSGSQSLHLFRQQDFIGPSHVPFKIIVFPEVPSFISVTDATDDGNADILAVLPSSDLLFLFKQEDGVLPDSPSMTFVTGALPNDALVGDANGDHLPDLIVSDSASHCLSIWHSIVIPPVVHAGGPYYPNERTSITLTGSVTTGVFEHQFLRYNWSFGDGSYSGWSGSPFATHMYDVAGHYPVEFRVTLWDGSIVIGNTSADVLNIPLTGDVSDLVITRNPLDTSNLTFDASTLAIRFPDIIRSQWIFGDGSSLDLSEGPNLPEWHMYNATRDYVFWLNLTDDEGSRLSITSTLKLVAPTIELSSPSNNTVMRSGTPIRFAISDDTPPLVSVMYAVDGDAYTNFSIQWNIPTTGWSEGPHTLKVKASDRDGNIALSPTFRIVIDDLSPHITVVTTQTEAFGGSKLNMTVKIDDANVNEQEVFLYVKLPGDASYQNYSMLYAGGGVFYRVIEIPSRSGDLMFNVTSRDLAGNSAASGVYTIHVKVHFIDAALPYMLITAILAALGVSAYFMREVDIAVDEAFVVYNDGRLIAHTTRRLKPGMDDQILGGMFVAIQDFVKDSFKDVTSFTLRKIEFGEKSVLIEKGDHVFLAVILHRKASKKVASKMEKVVAEIEAVFGEHLAGWDGDLDKVRGVGDLVKKLYSKAPLLHWPAK